MQPSDIFKNVDASRLEIFKKFNKTQNDVNQDVNIIKQWLEIQPHLPETMPDVYIEKFLYLNKYSIEKTKKKIDMYYSIRSLIPDFYNNANPQLPRMRKCWEIFHFCLHPKLVQGIYRVFMYKLLESNTASAVSPEIILHAINISEIRLQEDYAYKDIHIIDFEKFTISDIAAFTPIIIKKTVAGYQKVFSLPLQAAYFINAPAYVSTVLTILKAVVKPKIFQRIHVCGNTEILKDVFSVDDLPEDYGGNGPSLQELAGILRLKFGEYQHRYDRLDELRVKEELRPEPLVDDEILGFHGNFKKLDVD